MSRLQEMPLQSLLAWLSKSSHPWQTEPSEISVPASAPLQVLQVCHVLISSERKTICSWHADLCAVHHSRVDLEVRPTFGVSRHSTLCCRAPTRAPAAGKQARLAAAEGAPGRAL